MEDLWGFPPKQSNHPAPPPPPPKMLGGKSAGRMSKKFEKTKEKASLSMKKVKHGASDGVHWIKIKCHASKGGSFK